MKIDVTRPLAVLTFLLLQGVATPIGQATYVKQETFSREAVEKMAKEAVKNLISGNGYSGIFLSKYEFMDHYLHDLAKQYTDKYREYPSYPYIRKTVNKKQLERTSLVFTEKDLLPIKYKIIFYQLTYFFNINYRIYPDVETIYNGIKQMLDIWKEEKEDHLQETRFFIYNFNTNYYEDQHSFRAIIQDLISYSNFKDNKIFQNPAYKAIFNDLENMPSPEIEFVTAASSYYLEINYRINNLALQGNSKFYDYIKENDVNMKLNVVLDDDTDTRQRKIYSNVTLLFDSKELNLKLPERTLPTAESYSTMNTIEQDIKNDIVTAVMAEVKRSRENNGPFE